MSGYPVWNPSAFYTTGEIVSYLGTLYQALQLTSGDVPPSSPSFWTPVGGGGGVVSSVAAGTGISITGTPTNPVVNQTLVGTAGTYAYPASITTDNTGRVSAATAGTAPVLSVSAGTGITVGGTAQNPSVSNAGVLSVGAGFGMSISGTPQNPTLNNAGIVSVVAGSGIGVAIGPPETATVSNTGVLALTAGTGVSITGSPANYTISATGSGGTLTGIGAGTNISVDNTNPAVPVVGVATQNTTVVPTGNTGGSIAILTDPATGLTYYGLSSFQPTILTLDPANNGLPSNRWRAAGLSDVHVLANPQTGGTDLTIQILFSERAVYGKQFYITVGVPTTIISDNSIGNNNMTAQVCYEDNAGGPPTVVGGIQLSPQNYAVITPISPRSGNTNGTPYSYKWLRVNGAGAIGGIL